MKQCQVFNETSVVKKKVQVQVIQEKIYDVLTVRHCLISKISLITYCGSFSHASIVQNGLSSRVIPITKEEFNDIHRFQTFNYNGHFISDIPLNDTKYVEFTEIGRVSQDGTCYGVAFTNEQGTYQNSIMTTSLTIKVKDYESLFNLNEKNVIFKDGSTCPLDNGMCFNNFKGTTIWSLQSHENCDISSVDILYQGEATLVSQAEHEEINIFDMVMVNNDDNIFSYRINHISHICYQKVYKTNMNRI